MDLYKQLIDDILILRCQLGDREAFTELFQRHQVPVRYFIDRLVGDCKRAEDVSQQVWLVVLSKIRTLKNAQSFSSWLFRIARNACYRELRKNKQFNFLHDEAAVAEVSPDEHLLFEDFELLHECLARLQPEHREVLMLRFLKQMSYEDITETIGKSIGTVRSRMHYAKKALKKEMEKRYETE